jgi:hypothetical protein
MVTTTTTLSSSIASQQLMRMMIAFVAELLVFSSSSSTSSLLFASAQFQDNVTYYVMDDGDDSPGFNFSCSLVEAQCIFQEVEFSRAIGGGNLESVDDSGYTAWIVDDPDTDVLTLNRCTPAVIGVSSCIIACDLDCTCVQNTTDADSCLESSRFPTSAPTGATDGGATVAPTLVPTIPDDGSGGDNNNGTNTDNDGTISFQADMVASTFVCTSGKSKCNFLRSHFESVNARGGATSGAPADERVWKVSNPKTDSLTLNTCLLTTKEAGRCIVTCTSNCTCANAEGTACAISGDDDGGGEPGTTAPTTGGTNNNTNGNSTSSDAPSSVPSSAPTIENTTDGGGNDTLASDMPSSQPTAMPAGNVSTDMPTPSGGGGDGVSDAPSDMPSSNPATNTPPTVANNTKAPTPPSTGKPETSTFLQVQMTLDGVFLLDNAGSEIWTKTTTDFYNRVYNTDVNSSSSTSRLLLSSPSWSSSSSSSWWPNNDNNNNNLQQRHDHYRALLEKEGIYNFSTIITFVDQAVAGVTNTITYAQTISYLRTMDDAPSSWDLIQGPFQDAALNAQYTEELRNSSQAFASLMDNGVGGPSQETAEPPASEPVSKEASTGLSTAAIAGIAVGGFLGLLCCCCGCIAVFILLRDQRSGAPQNLDQSARRGEDDDGSGSRSHSRNDKVGNKKSDRRLGPLDEGDDEGSFQNDNRLRDHDSVDNADYNFDSAFGHEDDNERSIGIDHDDDDDDRFQDRSTGRLGEQIIEVDAPPGPLGVVVGTCCVPTFVVHIY